MGLSEAEVETGATWSDGKLPTMLCPVCGSPQCYVLSDGYFCPSCRTEVHRVG